MKNVFCSIHCAVKIIYSRARLLTVFCLAISPISLFANSDEKPFVVPQECEIELVNLRPEKLSESISHALSTPLIEVAGGTPFSVEQVMKGEALPHSRWNVSDESAAPVMTLKETLTKLHEDLKNQSPQQLRATAKSKKLSLDASDSPQEILDRVYGDQAAQVVQSTLNRHNNPDLKNTFQEYLVNYAHRKHGIPKEIGTIIFERSFQFSKIPGGTYQIDATENDYNPKSAHFVESEEFNISSLPITQGLALMVLGSKEKLAFSGNFSSKESDGYWYQHKNGRTFNLFFPALFTRNQALKFALKLETLYNKSLGFEDHLDDEETLNFSESDYSNVFHISTVFENTIASMGAPPVVNPSANRNRDLHLQADGLWQFYLKWLKEHHQNETTYIDRVEKYVAQFADNSKVPLASEATTAQTKLNQVSYSYERSRANFFGVYATSSLLCLEAVRGELSYLSQIDALRDMKRAIQRSNIENPYKIKEHSPFSEFIDIKESTRLASLIFGPIQQAPLEQAAVEEDDEYEDLLPNQLSMWSTPITSLQHWWVANDPNNSGPMPIRITHKKIPIQRVGNR
jgi:hypothetical protein